MLLSCGLADGGQKAADSEGGATSVTPGTPPGMVTPLSTSHDGPTSAEREQVSEDSEAGASSQASVMGSSVAPPAGSMIAYDGPTSLEERIFASPVIARVRLDSATSTAESGTIFDGSTKYMVILEFSFSVLDYLKGTGANDIVAVWDADPVFDTRQEAEAALPAIVAARDTQWDAREAIVFLQNSQTYLPSTQQTGRYYLSWERGSDLDDNYSIASRYNKLWLPAEAAVGAPSQPSGDQQRFLMDVPPGMKPPHGRILGTLPDGTFVLDGPPATGTAPTITLGEMKTRIAAVAVKLNAGDGSGEYLECIQRTYYFERRDSHDINTGGDGFIRKIPDHELDSGLAAANVVYEESPVFGDLPDKKGRTWLDGGDAVLFSVESGDAVPYDFSGDGVNDSIYFARRVVSARPLPAGVYRFHFNDVWAAFVPCDGYTIRYEWTVTVTAPEGTLHEAFFDPVTVGTAVAADSANGVLKPAGFTDANGASATINRIAWEAGTGESGTVKLKLSPHDGIAGHTLHFIALDGSVPLSLKVADATVDAPNDTLSWTVASQPWDDGDKLMLRIR